MAELTEHHRKVLTTYLGECLHNFQFDDEDYQFNEAHWKCENCGIRATDPLNFPNLAFITPADLHAVYSRIVEKGKWEEFLDYAEGVWFGLDKESSGTSWYQFEAWLYRLNCPDQIEEWMAMVAEWIEKLKGA